MGDVHIAPQEVRHKLPGTILAPLAEIVIDDLPGRQVMKQHSPGTATALQREEAVEDLARGIVLRFPPGFGLGDEMFDQCSFLIA